MTPGERDEVERAIAAVVRRLRDERAAELEPLRRRLDLLEQQLSTEHRIGAIERQPGVEQKAEPFDLTAFGQAWRSGKPNA
jgi:hypothetical protein